MILKLPADQSVTLEQRILFLRSENSLRFNSRTMEEFLKRVGMTHSGVCISTIHTSAKWEEDGQLAKE